MQGRGWRLTPDENDGSPDEKNWVDIGEPQLEGLEARFALNV
jgi:hypothetical protein